MNKHEAMRQNIVIDFLLNGISKEKKTMYLKYINEAETTEKELEELKDDIGVLLRVLDAPIDDPEAKYILDQIIIKLSKVGVSNETNR